MERNLRLSVNQNFCLTSQKSGLAFKSSCILNPTDQGMAGVGWSQGRSLAESSKQTAVWAQSGGLCFYSYQWGKQYLCSDRVYQLSAQEQSRYWDVPGEEQGIHNVSESWQPWAVLVTNPVRKDLPEVENTWRWAIITVLEWLLLVKWLQIMELGLLMLGRIWLQGIWSPSAQLSCGACCWAVAQVKFDVSSNTTRQINRKKIQ